MPDYPETEDMTNWGCWRSQSGRWIFDLYSGTGVGNFCLIAFFDYQRDLKREGDFRWVGEFADSKIPVTATREQVDAFFRQVWDVVRQHDTSLPYMETQE